MMPATTSVSMLRVRSVASSQVLVNAPPVGLVTTISSGRGASGETIAVVGESGANSGLPGRAMFLTCTTVRFDCVNHFRQWLQSEDDDIPDPEQDALRTMNCWEGVFYAAFKAGVTTKAALQAVYVNADSTSAAVNEAIGDRRTLRELKAADQAPEVGDVIIFGEVNNHVAISLGGDRVMSLWNQPGPHAVMAQTSMTALLPHTGGESLDSILVAKNCTLFQDPD